MPRLRQHSDEQILDALKRNGMNATRTARELNVSKARVVRLAKPNRPGKQTPPAPAFDPNLTEMEHLSIAVKRLCHQAARADIRKAGAKELGIMLGIAVDKLLLLAGRPTTIASNQSTEVRGELDFSKLTRKEWDQLLTIQDKLNGVPQPIMVSDLDNPVCYDPNEFDDESGS